MPNFHPNSLWCVSSDKSEAIQCVECGVLYSKESNPWVGELSVSQAGEHSAPGIQGKREFYRDLEAAKGEQGG